MIRTHYPLPEVEKDCNSVWLVSLDVANLATIVQPGTATISPEGVVDPATFVEDLDVPRKPEQVKNRAHFWAWYDAHEKNPADSPVQQFVSGMLLYLWLQRKDQLPNP